MLCFEAQESKEKKVEAKKKKVEPKRKRPAAVPPPEVGVLVSLLLFKN